MVAITTTLERRGGAVTNGRTRELMADAAEFFEGYLWESPNCDSARDALADKGLEKKVLRDFGVGYAPVRHHELMEHFRELRFTPEDLEAAGLLRVSPRGRIHEHFHSRIMFPVRDREGQVVGFAGLSTHLGPSWPLWVVSPDAGLYRREQAIFGFDLSAKQIKASKSVLVLRNSLDVLQAHQDGRRNAIAVHTGALTREQLGELGAVVPGGLDALELDLAPGMEVEPEPDALAAASAATVRRLDGPGPAEEVPRHLELKKVGLVTATALAAMNTWTGAPLLALWLGSLAQGGQVLSLRGVVTVLVVMSILVALLAWTLMWLNNRYDRLTGRPAIASQTSPWHRAKRGDRVQDVRSRYGISAPELAVVACVVVGVVAFEVWFFLFAGAPI